MNSYLQKYYFILLVPFFIILYTPLISSSQTFNYKIFTPADGLPEGNITILFKDSYGYMWIGSCAGLTRYDGKTFINYGLEDGLPSLCNTISFEDNEHQVWGTSGTSVIKFTGGRFAAFPFNAADSVSYIFSIAQTKENKIRAATTGGIFELDGAQWKKILLMANPPQKVVRQVLPLGNGSMLINYLYTIILKKEDGTTYVIADTSQCKYYTTILPYKNNSLIIGGNRLFIYDAKGLHAIHEDVIKNRRIFLSMVDAENRIWISVQNEGILIFDEDSVQRFGVKDGLPNSLNLGFCEDGEGNTWLGNFKGLIRLSPSFIGRFDKESGLSSADTRSMFTDHEGNIFFGHAGEGFSYWNHEKMSSSAFLLKKKKQYNSINIITCFSEDEKNRIWFTTYGGELFRYKNGSLEDLTPILNDENASLLSVKFNAGDSCIYVMSDSAIFSVKDDVLKEKMRVIINNHIAELQTSYIDRNNNLWLGAFPGEFGVFDLAKKTFYKSSLHLSPANVRQILEDAAGNIWIATLGKGVIKVACDSKKHITEIFSLTKKDGLTDDVVQSIVFDSTGKLWVLCSSGVVRFDLSRKNSDGHFLYETFTVDDGVSAKSFTDGNLLVDRQNNVWLSTSDGVFKFNNKKIFTDTLPAKIQIENVLFISDSSRWNNYTKKFSYYFHIPVNPVLPYNKNSFIIYYNAIAFSNQNQIEYSYRLDGLDTNWSINKTTYSSFVNLPAGNYVFRVKARKKNYAWSEEATFAFTISPPFWETWWFRTLEIIAASVLLIFVFRVRLHQVRKKALLQQQIQELELKALKAQMNPHFIYNAMNSIQSLVMNDKPEQAVRYLGKFAKLLRQVLDNSDKPLVPLQQELFSLQLYIELEALRLHKDFDYTIEVSNSTSSEEELVPPLILQPYVENALWHGLSNKAGERKLTIQIQSEENFLICRITDNGIGRTKAAEIKSTNSSNVSKGLNITHRRLSLMDNDDPLPVIIEDLYNETGVAAGTAVTLKIKRHPVA